MADFGANLRLRQPKIPDVEQNNTQRESKTRPENVQWNEWAYQCQTGQWMPNYSPEEAGTYR